MASPGLTAFAGFARSPFTDTCPATIASTARARVLKKRAAQSHLSIRKGQTPNLTSCRATGAEVPVSNSAPAITPASAICATDFAFA